jgi:hypothetical protein
MFLSKILPNKIIQKKWIKTGKINLDDPFELQEKIHYYLKRYQRIKITRDGYVYVLKLVIFGLGGNKKRART